MESVLDGNFYVLIFGKDEGVLPPFSDVEIFVYHVYFQISLSQQMWVQAWLSSLLLVA